MTDSRRDDSKGRWRPGGRVYVPVRVAIKSFSNNLAKDARRGSMDCSIYPQISNCTHTEFIHRW